MSTRSRQPPDPPEGEEPTTSESGDFKREASTPIRAISMKAADEARSAEPMTSPTPHLARPKLRDISEVTPIKQQSLGNLAPPYDPKAARARSVREYVIWGCLSVILASSIALGMWFLAR